MPTLMMQSSRSNDFLGWMSRQGEEIGDQPISAAGGVLTRVFSEVKLTGKKTTVPVQFMYSALCTERKDRLPSPISECGKAEKI